MKLTDKEIVRMLKNDFIPVAFDQWYLRYQQDTEGDFYRKIASQGPRKDFRRTTQGFYVVAPDGEFFYYNNNQGPERIRTMMKAALREFKPREYEAIKPAKVDKRYVRKLPKGGAVVRVNAKILEGYRRARTERQKAFQSAVSRDNLWILPDELKQLQAGKFPESLGRRIARYHLIDNTRGEPNMWRPNQVKKIDWKLDGENLTGAVKLETRDGKRGYETVVKGKIKVENSKLKQFDLVAKGEAWGEGTWTKGAPKGKFTLAIAFRLADNTDTADRVAPEGTKGDLKGYLKP